MSEHHDLQKRILGNPDILGENLLIIQKEFDGFSDTNERLDLLALDESGRIVVIENKLDDSGRDVVWQALKYVSYCATLTKSEICEIYQHYLGSSATASENISEFYEGQDYENIRLNPAEANQRIILVGANFRKEVTSTALWLRNYHGVDITCIKVTPYKDGNKLYLDVEQIIPMQDALDYQIRLNTKKQEEALSSNKETVRHKLRYRFWERALPIIREKSGVFVNVSPTKDNWLFGTSGHSGIYYNAVIRKDGARAELFISKSDRGKNKGIFNQLKARENEIKDLFDQEIDWRKLPNKNTSCISIHYKDYGLDDEEHWGEIIKFLASNIAALVTSFKPMLDEIVKD